MADLAPQPLPVRAPVVSEIENDFRNEISSIVLMNKKSTIAGIVSLSVLAARIGYAQTNLVAGDSKPSMWNSYGQPYPRVDSQSRGIFRLEAPEARQVKLHLDKDYEMLKGTNGVWTVTTKPQAVGFHYYWFLVDGVNVPDPASDSFFGVGRNYSGIEIPSPGEDFYDIKNVPHGELRSHWYFSDLAQAWRRCVIYTPPGYDANPTRRYPVLYLLHGAGEDQSGWGTQGRAGFILDNLIADGKAKSMILVMDNGGGNSFGGGGRGAPGGPGAMTNGPARADTNAPVRRGGPGGGGGPDFGKIMTTEIIPMIDSNFRTITDQPHRAIAGLSMGSMQAVSIGMANLDKFSAIGSFSGASITNVPLANPTDFNSKVSVVFASFGSVEGGSSRLKREHDALVAGGVTNSYYYISPGTAHEWETWRRSLHEMAPLLFRN
jgi:enterochelin esterase family protein